MARQLEANRRDDCRRTVGRRLPFPLLWLVAALVSSAPGGMALTGDQRAWLDDHPVIRLAPDPDFAPIEFFEGDEYVGIAADYVALIEDALGIEFEIVRLPDWAEVEGRSESPGPDQSTET